MTSVPKLPRRDAIISANLDDASISGVIVEVDPDEADSLGAFLEDAIDEATAWESNADL